MTNIIELCNGKYLYLCDYHRIINAELKDVFLANSEAHRIRMHDVKVDEHMLRRKLRKIKLLIMEVTESCNLRCKYCIYNDKHENIRSFTNQEMNLETAQKGIDYIFSILQGRKDKIFNIGFYGGEPLLNFKLMEKIIDYSRSKFTGWDLRYNLTTNMTVMNDEILDFLVKNDVSLLVSLDGDQKNHDAKRVFENGKGSFSAVIKNLKKIQTNEEEYYNKNIYFNTTHSFDLPLENLREFASTNELVQKKGMRFGSVFPYPEYYQIDFPYNVEQKREDFKNWEADVKEKKRKKEKLTSLDEYFNRRIDSISALVDNQSLNNLAQTCLFDARLYIDTNGRFHACEKMNNTLPIGDVENGLDLQKMAKIVKEFQKTIVENCSDCDVRFICNKCFKPFAGDGKIEIPANFCKNQKRGSIENLEMYVQHKEEGLI